MKEIVISNTEENLTPIVRNALEQLRDTEEAILRFECGKYYFGKDGSYEGAFYPSNNASGIKKVVFPLIEFDQLTIDGGGSEFIFCDRVFPFIIQSSKNIVLKNFTIDFSFPRHCQGKISASNDRGFIIDLESEYRTYDIKNGAVFFKTGGDIISTEQKKIFIEDLTDRNVGVAYLFIGNCRDNDKGLAAPVMRADAFNDDCGIRFAYRAGSIKKRYGIGDIIFIGNDENRENDVIFCEFSNTLLFDNITIHRGAGMGIIAQLCENIDINRLRITPREESEYLSITADAIHAINCSGYFNIRNSFINKSIDDAVNIHGAYAEVKKVIDNNIVSIGYSHKEQSGLIPCRIGDTLHINDPKTLEEIGTVMVKNISYSDDRSEIFLTVSENSDLINEGCLLENPDRMPDILFENNEVYNCPHMLFSSSKNTVIKNNRLNLTACEICAHDEISYWFESGAVGEMVIRGNKFMRKKGYNILLDTSRSKNTLHRHRKVIIENNSFAAPQPEVLYAEALDELIMRHNSFSQKD